MLICWLCESGLDHRDDASERDEIVREITAHIRDRPKKAEWVWKQSSRASALLKIWPRNTEMER